MNPLQIFRAGTHAASNGQTLTFSMADVEATAAAYDPTKHEAPIVVGHPATDEPAYGWVQRLAVKDGALEAVPTQMDAGFSEMVNAGRFKKISAAFFTPTAKNNPVSGVYYLRHVGFLGAAAPAVKGLRAPQFSDADEGVITLEFSEPDPITPENPMPNPTVAVPNPDPLAAEKAALAQREAAIQERENAVIAQLNAAKQAADAAFAEALIKEGRLLPRDKTGVVQMLGALTETAPISFAEGGEVVQKTPRKWLEGFLKAMPVQVDFSERTKATQEEESAVTFNAPAGFAVDSAQLAIHQRALAYQAAHPDTDYVTALTAISR